MGTVVGVGSGASWWSISILVVFFKVNSDVAGNVPCYLIPTLFFPTLLDFGNKNARIPVKFEFQINKYFFFFFF